MAAKEDTDIVRMDMCAFGMSAEKDGVKMPVQKPTQLMSNSPELVRRLDRRCPNRPDHGRGAEGMGLVARWTAGRIDLIHTVCVGVYTSTIVSPST